MFFQEDPRISTFLVKVASRCNLNCDYCYVFNHADQSWKDRPALMSDHHVDLLAQRLSEYTQKRSLDEILVVFHGGEPLLMGSEKICGIANKIREAVPSHVIVDFSLQTNGVILRERDIIAFSQNKIGVSLSLDGPQKANDLHRLTHTGMSSFSKVKRAFDTLKQYPDVFTGVISVVDVRVSPQELFAFFDELSPPCLDFLLPDANYASPPLQRATLPGVYQQWLHEAFNLWLDKYSHIPVRFFDNLVAAISGSKSGTDAFGFGDVSLLSIETDGTYHDLDVLKITKNNFSSLGMDLETHSIYDASLSPKIKAHRSLLSMEGLCSTCQKCSVVNICAGGSVPHRYDGEGFNNPTVYCAEMFSLINNVKARISDLLNAESTESARLIEQNPTSDFDVVSYNASSPFSESFQHVYKHWVSESERSFTQALDYAEKVFPEEISDCRKQLANMDFDTYARFLTLPQIHLWSYVSNQLEKGLEVFDLDEKPIQFDLSPLINFLSHPLPKDHFFVHQDEMWLQKPFGSQIVFERDSIQEMTSVLSSSLEIIKWYNPELYNEMRLISPTIQFIQDLTAHPDKLVSFSDNMVPGALYVRVRLNNKFADPYDLADSLIHEHRHQKMYLLEKLTSVVDSDIPYVSSPWREEPRPVSGLFHAVFVFAELQSYWASLIDKPGNVGTRAKITLESYSSMLREGICTLKSVKLTSIGYQLLSELEKIVDKNATYLAKEISDVRAA